MLFSMSLSGTFSLLALPAFAQTADSVMQRAALPLDVPVVPRFAISQFKVEGNTVLPAETVAAAVAPFTGPARDFGDVQQAMEALEAIYKARGYSSVSVLLPEQALESGSVLLRIVEGRIRRIEVEGNQHFDKDNILASLPSLKIGGVPIVDEVSSSLRVANENPAKKITLQLSPGEEEADIDAKLKVTDEAPWKVGLTLDNTGSGQTGNNRLGVSYQHSNMFNRDQILTLQYQTSPQNIKDVTVYAVAYRLPIYGWGDVLDVFATKSSVNAGTIAAGPFNLAITGRGESYGAKYTIKLKRIGDYDHEIVAGLDSKLFENSITAGTLDLGSNLEVHPVSVQYNGHLVKDGRDISANVSLIHNIPGGTDGGQAAFDKARTGSVKDYTVLRAGAILSQSLTAWLDADWQARVALSAQYVAKPVIPGEQFGAGGASSVRGFEEREVASDKGLQGNLELYTPELCAKLWASQQCRAVVFYDWAKLNRVDPLPTEEASQFVSSTGVGVRWTISKDVAVQTDYATLLRGTSLRPSGGWKVHARVGVFF